MADNTVGYIDYEGLGHIVNKIYGDTVKVGGEVSDSDTGTYYPAVVDGEVTAASKIKSFPEIEISNTSIKTDSLSLKAPSATFSNSVTVGSSGSTATGTLTVNGGVSASSASLAALTVNTSTTVNELSAPSKKLTSSGNLTTTGGSLGDVEISSQTKAATLDAAGKTITSSGNLTTTGGSLAAVTVSGSTTVATISGSGKTLTLTGGASAADTSQLGVLTSGATTVGTLSGVGKTLTLEGGASTSTDSASLGNLTSSNTTVGTLSGAGKTLSLGGNASTDTNAASLGKLESSNTTVNTLNQKTSVTSTLSLGGNASTGSSSASLGTLTTSNTTVNTLNQASGVTSTLSLGGNAKTGSAEASLGTLSTSNTSVGTLSGAGKTLTISGNATATTLNVNKVAGQDATGILDTNVVNLGKTSDSTLPLIVLNGSDGSIVCRNSDNNQSISIKPTGAEGGVVEGSTIKVDGKDVPNITLKNFNVDVKGSVASLSGGSTGSIPYQVSSSSTAFLAPGATDEGKYLKLKKTTEGATVKYAPEWQLPDATEIKLSSSYEKAATAAAPAKIDSIETAVGKLQKEIEGKTSNTGTVTSVGLSLPSIFSTPVTPVTTSGTLAATLVSETKNTVFAAPSGSDGIPSFRSLVAVDIPSLTTAKISNFATEVAKVKVSNADAADSATKASQDGNGDSIVNTYAKKTDLTNGSLPWKTSGSITTISDITAQSFTATSSRKYKENIKDTTINGLNTINNVNVVDYNYIHDESKQPHVGFIAEDTDAILSTQNRDKMDYTNCIGVLIKAVQELSDKVNYLERKLAAHEDDNR